MPKPKLISPLLNGFAIGDPISDHHGVQCCPALRENTGERCIVKIISVPASQVQVDALFLTGAFSAHFQALSYFEELSKDVAQEVEVLEQLAKLEGFLPYTGMQIEEMSVGTGYQIYLISPYKRSLTRQMQLAPLTHLQAVNLGLDLCAALVTSRRAGYLYVDLKPNNVFLTQTNGWRIGDLGFIALSSLKYASLPDKYRSEYTPREIRDAMSELNDTIDIYGLGLILYQIFNNGQLPFDTISPGEPVPPPMYADYEFAEIILKACDPDPAKRWKDPIQMGQAIVAYMQRNSVNDTPIVPPPVEPVQEVEAPPEEELPTEDESEAALEEMMKDLLEEDHPAEEDEEKTPAVTDESEELSFINEENDETAPSEEIAAELEDVLVSEDVEQMLAQADELISHELPEPPVAPEPIDVPFPAPIVLEEDNNSSEEEPGIILPDLDNSSEDASSETSPDDEEIDILDALAFADDPPVQPDAAQMDEYDDIPDEQDVKKKGSKSKLKTFIVITSVVLFLVAAGFGITFFYQQYYLQSINSLTIDGDVHTIAVQIHSEIDDALLSVICTDTYGNARSSAVANGLAQFTDLNPNTQYRIQVKITGLHRLMGNTSGSFTTPAQTEIMNLSAIAGPEDGSVILSFAVNGPEPNNWIVTYSTANEPDQSITFSGHTVTVSSLTIGSNYKFELTADEGQYLTGVRELNYIAPKIIYAQDLHITSCNDGIIGVAWNAPEDATSQNWIVRCYGDAGFDETITTAECAAQFNVPTHECAYTIDVTAEGMTSKTPVAVSANPITVTQFKEEVSNDGTLKLTWSFTGNPPASGWIVSYSIDGTAAISMDCASNEVALPYYPGSHYEVNVRPVDEITCLSETFSYDAPQAEAFEQYRLTAADMSFKMCLTPDKENWDRHDVDDDDYRKKFAVGEKASFVVKQNGDRKKSKDEITISYIIRDENGAPISLDMETTTWNGMWDGRYCELNIPKMPTVAGKYSIEIYFNGYHVTTKSFSII